MFAVAGGGEAGMKGNKPAVEDDEGCRRRPGSTEKEGSRQKAEVVWVAKVTKEGSRWRSEKRMLRCW